MAKSLKVKLLTVLVLVLSFCFTLSFATVSLAKAEVTPVEFSAVTETNFVMSKGALIRVNKDNIKDNGLMFQAELPTSVYQGLKAQTGATVKVGFVIAPEHYVDAEHPFTVSNLFGDNAIYGWNDNVVGQTPVEGKVEIWHIDAPKVVEGLETTKFLASVIDFDTTSKDGLTREYVGLAYISCALEGSETEYKMASYAETAQANNTRSMAFIAQSAITAKDEKIAEFTNFEDTFVKPVTYDKAIFLDEIKTLPVKDIVGDETATVNSAYAFSTDTITVENNIIKGFAVDANKENIRRAYVKTSAGTRFVDIIPCDKVIANASDLDVLKVANTTDLKKGYYVLTANIDYQNAEFKHGVNSFTSATSGFNGIFDGNGHTIENIKLKKGGLFGVLHSATDDDKYLAEGNTPSYSVKNLGIKGVTLVGGDANVICRTLTMNQTNLRYRFENVYIQVTALPGTSGFGIICTENMRQYTEFNNVIIDTGDLTTTASQYGVLAQYGANSSTIDRINGKSTNGENNGKPRIQNTYVLSNMILSYWSASSTHTSDYCDDAGNKSVLSETNLAYRANTYTEWSAIEGNVTSNDLDIVNQYAKIAIYKGIIRYTPEDLASLEVGTNDYSSFEASGYWNVSGNIPVWVGATA